MVNKKLFTLPLVTLLLAVCFLFVPGSAHAATVAPGQPVHPAGQTQVWWSENSECSLAQVSIHDLVGNGSWYCFYLTQPGDWGHLGMGDPGGPGDIFQAYSLDDPYTGPGWIRYYGGNYLHGTFCRLNNGQYVRLPYVDVTQIAINVPNSYHQCP